MVLAREQVTLWSHVLVVVLPEGVSARDLERGHIGALRGEEAGRDVGDPVGDDDPGAHGPHGDHSAVPGEALVIRRDALLPDELAVRGSQAVHDAVVRASDHLPTDDGRRETNRGLGVVGPELLTRRGVEAVDLLVRRGAEEDAAVGDRDVEGAVKPEPRREVHDLVVEVVPCGPGPRVLRAAGGGVDPLLGEGEGEVAFAGAGARRVAAEGRPISAGEGRG